MKEYLVSIKRIQKINLVVSEKNSKKALNKVRRFVNDCDNNNLNFERLFDGQIKFQYSIKRFSNK